MTLDCSLFLFGLIPGPLISSALVLGIGSLLTELSISAEVLHFLCDLQRFVRPLGGRPIDDVLGEILFFCLSRLQLLSS